MSANFDEWRSLLSGEVRGVKLVDNFEDGDLSEYSVNGNGATVGTSSTRSFSGSTSFVIDSPSGNEGNPITVSNSGLDNYPTYPTVINLNVYFEPFEDYNAYFIFGKEDGTTTETNNFRINIARRSNEMIIQSVTSGNVSNLETVSQDWSNYSDEWLRIEVDWGSSTDGEIVATVYDSSGSVVQSISATSSEHQSNQGIGYLTANDSAASAYNAYFDYVRTSQQ